MNACFHVEGVQEFLTKGSALSQVFLYFLEEVRVPIFFIQSNERVGVSPLVLRNDVLASRVVKT